MTAETSQTLDRGLRVLKLLADTDHGLTVTELSNRLGVNRTVVYRLLATLEQHALVRRDLGGRARVGLGVLRLSRQVHPLVREAALPALRSLAEDIGATAHLTLVDGAEALAVAVVEPTWTDYHVAYRTGFRHSLERGAAGRAILAARQNAYSEPACTLTAGELEAGASGAAAALIGVTGIEGSVGVVMLADAVPERVGPRVLDAAREVADALR
ncbi:IclR family transcriptional regulator [Streptomyces paludis]|uniref:HTH domain-containing protein n=1 Tax=Streptomyces paludis TaxID=2282738 RepID=A0A345HN30_9ACTN|nr:helix-turn-helix domain-containing protein [Streptomyces paludis]AXG78104.1 HTH domain-containing protein [Streptomyces paludis]